jgi:hypothetical protein
MRCKRLAIEICSTSGRAFLLLKLFRGFNFETWARLPRVAELDGAERDLPDSRPTRRLIFQAASRLKKSAQLAGRGFFGANA